MVASLSGLSSVALTNIVPVEFLCRSFGSFLLKRLLPSSPRLSRKASDRPLCPQKTHSGRGRGGFLFIGRGSAWRHAAARGPSDLLRLFRDDDRRDVVASSYRNESSTVDKVRTRPSSSVEDVDGRDTGGRGWAARVLRAHVGGAQSRGDVRSYILSHLVEELAPLLLLVVEAAALGPRPGARGASSSASLLSICQ